jgi:hypothetical protein
VTIFDLWFSLVGKFEACMGDAGQTWGRLESSGHQAGEPTQQKEHGRAGQNTTEQDRAQLVFSHSFQRIGEFSSKQFILVFGIHLRPFACAIFCRPFGSAESRYPNVDTSSDPF